MIFRVPGPCAISWDGNTLGVTKAGVVIRSTPNWIPITDDEHGAEPADYLWAGRIITVECVGLDMTAIDTAQMFKPLYGTDSVGDIISDETGNVILRITESDDAYWEALNTEPLPPELLLNASRELHIPLTFMILYDANGELFSSLPNYIAA